jgi:hypothetical protein
MLHAPVVPKGGCTAAPDAVGSRGLAVLRAADAAL